MKETFKLLSTNKKTMLHCVLWRPEGEVKAVVQISHGMCEFIERYSEFAEFLNSKGIAVIGNDHLGHGKSVHSTEEWGFFTSRNGFTVLVRDLVSVTKKAKEEYPDVPIILLGHSMGSFVVRRYIINYGHFADAAIIMGTGNANSMTLMFGRLVAGFISLRRGYRYRSDYMQKLCFGSYNNRIKDSDSPAAWLSRDEEKIAEYASYPETQFIFTVRALDQMFETIQYVKSRKMVKRVPPSLPILVISGTEDPVGEYGKAVKKVYRSYKKAGIKDLTLKLIEGDRHEVLNEIDRAENYEYILQWIVRVIDSKN